MIGTIEGNFLLLLSCLFSMLIYEPSEQYGAALQDLLRQQVVTTPTPAQTLVLSNMQEIYIKADTVLTSAAVYSCYTVRCEINSS